MVVSVQFHGVHRTITRVNEIELSLSSNARVTDLIAQVKAAYPDLHLSPNDFQISINDRISTPEHPLGSNDTVAFLPHIGGG